MICPQIACQCSRPVLREREKKSHYCRSAQSEEAADVFEELTYASQWKVVMVNVLGYKQQGNTTIPCVQIIDSSGPVVSSLQKSGCGQFCALFVMVIMLTILLDFFTEFSGDLRCANLVMKICMDQVPFSCQDFTSIKYGLECLSVTIRV